MAESNGPNNEHLSNGVEENGPKSASQMSEDELKAQVEALKPELIKHARKSLMKGDTWYLIDSYWYKQLRKYLGLSQNGYDSTQEGGSQTSSETLAPDPTNHPGPIDNTRLFKETTNEENGLDEAKSQSVKTEIRDHMIDDLDYVVVPQEGWTLLVETFGTTPGQEPVERKVVEHGMFVKHCKVEVYKVEFLLAENGNPDKTVKKRFSKADTLSTIDQEMRKIFDIPDNVETRLWNRYTANTYEQLGKLDATVQDTGLYSGQPILIEQKNPDGTWPRVAKSTDSALATIPNNSENHTSNRPNPVTASGSSSSLTGAIEKRETTPGPSHQSNVPSNNSSVLNNSGKSSTAVTSSISTRYNFGGGYSSDGTNGGEGAGDKAQPGVCGLANLGNTCFMNSIIQGLSNVPPVTEYFACDNYVEDINEDNPLGMKGEIARAFGELTKNLWSGCYTYVVPRNFKMAVGRFAPSFSGYAQQDSQELLTFLLDGLHEDLNRIKKKPYIEIKDSNGRPDEEVAKEAWSIYKKRNDSVILDLFHGLLKSTVVCPECPKISVTFDPFCYLSLPLPVRKERQIEVFLVFMPKEGQALCPTQYKVTCPKNGCMRDLCDALARLTDGQVSGDKLIVTDVYNNRFHKIYNSDDGLHHILERDDIFIYEVPTTDVKDPDHVIVPIYLREKKSSLSYSPSNLFGQPQLISLPKNNLTYENLYNHLLNRLQRYVTPPPMGQIWWKSNANTNNNDDDNRINNNGNESLMNGETTTNTDDDADGLTSSKQQPESTVTSNGENDDGPNDNTNNQTKTKYQNGTAGTNCTENDDPMNEDLDEFEDEEDQQKGPPKLFIMNLVNSYGNAQLEQLENDGQPLQITNKNYLSLDWHSKAKQLFYNEKAAEEIAQDKSFHDKSPAKKQQSVCLSECLELYTTKEQLGEDDAWYCPSCQKPQQATKKFDLWSLPSILVISLKRFSFNRYWRDKLDTHVDFPIQGLDMQPYIINKNHGEAIYDLLAVSNHYGGMGGGHYTAYAKNKDDGRWYYFDDSSVTSSSEDAVVTKAAYVLFYQRRDLSNMSKMPIVNDSRLCNGQTNSKNHNGMNGSLATEQSPEEDMEVDQNGK